METFRYGDVLLRRRCVYRRFVWRRFVEETFCMCAYFSMDLLAGSSFYEYELDTEKLDKKL
jgi:hypothetical protein